MHFKIEPKIFEQFPELRVGVVVLDIFDNTGNTQEILERMHGAEQEVSQKYANTQLGELSQIQCWRKAYKSFGAQDYRSSVEALLRRAIKGELLSNINDLVNLYNYLSLKYLMPFGGEDLDKIKGDIVLGYAGGAEPCILLGETENRPPKVGEIVYKDDVGVLCRRWNWREAERTKLEKTTRRAVLVCEDLFSGSDEVVVKAVEEALKIVREFLHGTGYVRIMALNNRECQLL